MMRMRIAMVASALLVSGCAENMPVRTGMPVLAEADVAIAELLAADQALSVQGAGRPIADALAPGLSDDVKMPARGGMHSGKPAVLSALAANAALAGPAEWAPIGGGVSSDGLHGFTYGFMQRPAGSEPGRLKYLAYWVKTDAGWRIAGYKRGVSPAGEVSAEARPPLLLKPSPRTTGTAASLADAEKAFSDRAQVVGLARAFAEKGTPLSMNLGQGSGFTYSAEAIGADMPKDVPSPLHWSADHGVLIAPSGDLGVTFGHIHFHAPQPGQGAIPFFTVWAIDPVSGEWRYVAE